MYRLKTKMLPGEFWYGGHTNYGFMMPVGKWKVWTVDTRYISSSGQANTLLLSNKGRMIYCDKGFKTDFVFGTIKCSGKLAEIKLAKSDNCTLKGAYQLALKLFMQPDGKYPNELMFTIPQYCTWIQLDNKQNQKGILDYAQSILDCGMPAGELIIDDGWQVTFGEWKFRKEAFENAKEMIDKLKSMGFKIIMWICPFISAKCADYEMLVKKDALVKDSKGNIATRTWWNGKDALLDFSNPIAVTWFEKQTDYLVKMGVDGFKQDAGDSMYYCDDDITYGNVDANTQSELWALSSRRYEFNELRACFKCGLMGVAQRLADKSHLWGILGLGALIPNALIQGLMGYPYTCPDMIGGGQMGDFRGKDPASFDHELFARYCETSALMPMMQYSLAIWDLGNEATRKICQDMTKLHMEKADYIMDCVKKTAVEGEPIVRFMEYSFPNRGYAKIKDQFVLGDEYIVAPILKKGQTKRKVYIPDGEWQFEGKIYTNEVAVIEADITKLIYLKKVK